MPVRSHTSRPPARIWWIPVLLAVAAAGAVLASTAFEDDEPSTAVATVRLDARASGNNATAERAVAESAETRQLALDDLAASGVATTDADLVLRSSFAVDPGAGALTVAVTGDRSSDAVIAASLAQAYVDLSTNSVAAERDARARFLAEQTSTMTRDLLTANVIIEEARSDERQLDRLESRVLALEVERDRLELDGASTADVERQLDILRSQVAAWEPVVPVTELARAAASADLLTGQLETLRAELFEVAGPAASGAELVGVSTVEGAAAASVDGVLLLAAVSAAVLLGLVVMLAFGQAPVVTVTAPEPRLVPNGATASPIAVPTQGLASERLTAQIAPSAPRPSAVAGATPTAVGQIIETPPAIVDDRPAEALPTVGSIPAAPPDHVHPLTINHPDSPAGQAYAQLTEALISDLGSSATPSIAFVGPGRATGRTTVAVNVAAAANAAGHDVLLVTPLWEEVDIPGLPVLPPGLGITDADHFPAPNEFADALADVASMIDVVIVDTDPADLHPDVAALAAQTELTAIVVMTGRSNVAAVTQLAEDLRSAGAQIAGVVVNAHEAAVSH